MIAPQELRRNNLIRDIESGIIGAVLTIGEKKCTIKMPFSKLSQSYEEFEPIELTEEWLEKFGLSNDGTMTYVNATEFSIYKKIDYKYYLSEWAGSTVGELKYVHQLQNLFHSLTGEELKIKES